MTGARELDGERRAPGTGAEYGDGFLRDVVAGVGHGRAHERGAAALARWRVSSPGPARRPRPAAARVRARTAGRSPPAAARSSGSHPASRGSTRRRAHTGTARSGRWCRWRGAGRRRLRPRIANRPACLTSTRNAVASPCLAPTVTVSTTSLSSGATTLAVVLMSSEICGFQLPSMRGPFGRLVRAILEIDGLDGEHRAVLVFGRRGSGLIFHDVFPR